MCRGAQHGAQYDFQGKSRAMVRWSSILIANRGPSNLGEKAVPECLTLCKYELIIRLAQRMRQTSALSYHDFPQTVKRIDGID